VNLLIIKKISFNNFEEKLIGIAGVKSVKVRNPDDFFNKIDAFKKRNVIIQFFNADLIAGWEHVFFSTVNAYNAFHQKRNISNKIEIEIMLYVSAQRQIKSAIDSFGVNEDTSNLAILAIAESEENIEKILYDLMASIGGTMDDSVLEINDHRKFEKICKAFNISLKELKAIRRSDEWHNLKDALTKSIISRSALLVFE